MIIGNKFNKCKLCKRLWVPETYDYSSFCEDCKIKISNTPAKNEPTKVDYGQITVNALRRMK